MISEILEYIEDTKENLSTDDIKRKFKMTEQEWEIIFPFLISNGVKINTFESLNLKCNNCPINNFCNKKRCGG